LAEDTPSGGKPPSGSPKGPSKESIDIATKLNQSISELTQKYASLNSEIEKSQKILSAAGASGKKASLGFTRSMKMSEGIINSFKKSIVTASRQISMATNAFTFFGRTVIGVGRSFLSFPIALFGTIANKAAELLNGSTALRQAYENVRKTFGDLSKNESKSVLTSFKQLRASSSSLGGSTLSLSRIYGYGPDGLAKALEELTETAHAMGPVFGLLKKSFETNADDLLIYQKGLGLTAEQMKSFGSIAIATGTPLEDLLKETGNLALQMGDKFGISSKELGRDLGYMTQNMGKFGSMTKTQMITSTVFTRKLGLEIKELEGLISKFDDFESTAEGASRLAQAFGMNVDALEMMKEQDPARRLDMLRKSFAATGKSIENMSRQERALLAETSGLDENTVALALSTKNMGLSYDQVQKEAEKSNKKQKSQAEIMQGLSENIERFVESIQHSGSFLTQFLNGFMRGISRSKVFREALHDMATALRSVYQFGIKVGEVFVTAFPGVEGMIRSIGNFVKLITAASKSGEGAIASFFNAFSTAEGAKRKVGELFDMFMGVGVQAGGPLSEFNKEYNKFLNSIANGIAAIIPRIADELVKAIDETINSLDAAFTAFGDEVNTKALSPGARILFSLFEGLERVVPKLAELVGKVFWMLITDERTKNYMMIGLTGLFAWIAGPTALSFVSSLFINLLTTAVSAGFASLLSGGGAAAAAGGGAAAAGGGAAGAGLLSSLFPPAAFIALAVALTLGIGWVFKTFKSSIVSILTTIFGDDIAWYIEKSILNPFIMLFDGLTGIFSGILSLFRGSIQVFRGLSSAFMGDSTILMGGLKEIGRGIYNFFLGIMDTIVGAIGNIPILGGLLVEGWNGLKSALSISHIEAEEIRNNNQRASQIAASGIKPPEPTQAQTASGGFGDMFSVPRDNSLVGQSRAVVAVGDESRKLKKAAQALSDAELQEQLLTARAGIDSLDGFYSRLSTSSFFTNYEEIGNKFSGTSASLAQVSSGKFGTVAKEAAKDIVEMNKALASLDPVKMDATLDRLGENLSFKNEVLNIERKPVVVNIDLNLSIKAEEFVKDYEKVKSNMILRGERIA
jgi:hypothetical protein